MQNPYGQHFKKRKEVARKQVTPVAKKKTLPVASKRRRSKFPMLALVQGLVLLAFLAVALHYEKPLMDKLAKIELGIFGKAVAQNASKPAGQAIKKKDSLDKFAEEKKNKQAQKKSWTEEEIALFSALEARKQQLDQREQNLARLEKELKQQQEELQKQLAEMKRVRADISSQLEESIQKDDERINKLVEVYSNMKPQQAAKVIEKIDESLAIRVLAKMKKKNAAEVLNLLEPDKAKLLSEKYVGYISMN